MFLIKYYYSFERVLNVSFFKKRYVFIVAYCIIAVVPFPSLYAGSLGGSIDNILYFISVKTPQEFLLPLAFHSALENALYESD